MALSAFYCCDGRYFRVTDLLVAFLYKSAMILALTYKKASNNENSQEKTQTLAIVCALQKNASHHFNYWLR